MLESLVIKNVALIDSAELVFSEGLNVLSGETGSGKSVIIESLNFVLGAKADRNMIRSGEESCSVSATFNVASIYNVKEIFEELDVEYDDECIITRKFSIDGKSTIKINGTSVTVSMLKKLTSKLVDVHGQSEHYELLSTSNQLKLIDNVGEKEILPIKEQIKGLFGEYKQICSSLDELGSDENSRIIRLDVLNYQINEIENADVKEGEFEKLVELKNTIKHREKILNSLNFVKSTLDREGGVSDNVSSCYKAISNLSNISSDYNVLTDRLGAIYSEIDDISSICSDCLAKIDVDEIDVDKIEARLDLIKGLFRKYGGDFVSLDSFLSNAIIEKDKLENFNKNAKELLTKKSLLENTLYKSYSALSTARRNVANSFSNKVLKELLELGMSKSQFVIAFNEIPSLNDCKFTSDNGFDEIEFLFSANLGEPLKPLSFVISGGEMSRFMLSIKAQSANKNQVSTYIFDEIDTGISGNVAKIVAQKFAKIAKNVQIIAITHLPQISSMGDVNILISKSESDDKTITKVARLSKEQKIDEIIRLVGGNTQSQSAKELAIDLIKQAEDYKLSL